MLPPDLVLPDGAGRKDDEDKVPLDLISPLWLHGTGQVLNFGAKKYGAYNWARGMMFSRLYAAALRHLTMWWGGEELDPETGLHHLFHASCCLMFLSHMHVSNAYVDFDDRKWGSREGRTNSADQ